MTVTTRTPPAVTVTVTTPRLTKLQAQAGGRRRCGRIHGRSRSLSHCVRWPGPPGLVHCVRRPGPPGHTNHSSYLSPRLSTVTSDSDPGHGHHSEAHLDQVAGSGWRPPVWPHSRTVTVTVCAGPGPGSYIYPTNTQFSTASVAESQGILSFDLYTLVRFSPSPFLRAVKEREGEAR